MPDTAKLHKLVSKFESDSRPRNADRSAPCTVGDIKNVVENLAKVLNAFVDEMEDSE